MFKVQSSRFKVKIQTLNLELWTLNRFRCRERDSNSHALRHWLLRPAWLPITPSRQVNKQIWIYRNSGRLSSRLKLRRILNSRTNRKSLLRSPLRNRLFIRPLRRQITNGQTRLNFLSFMRNPPALSPSLTGFSNGGRVPADAVKTFPGFCQSCWGVQSFWIKLWIQFPTRTDIYQYVCHKL